MICVGIEGTAHTIGVGIVDDIGKKCNVLSNIIKIYRPKQGGIHPREAANHHASHVASLIKESAEKAQVDFADIDLVSFSKGPGLGPCLRTAATAARALSLSLDKPIMGVNHCVAHLEIGRGTLDDCKDPVLLYTILVLGIVLINLVGMWGWNFHVVHRLRNWQERGKSIWSYHTQ
jgi:N6-L-threonylcarbamoyladenine synthase/N6-L-threonylcarbamoyladenine synthase/protein kinase Bud32